MTGSAVSAGPRPRHLVRSLLGASHPAPTVAVTTVAVLLAVGVGLSAARVVLLGAAILSGQLSIGWSNDSIDSTRDTTVGRSDKPVAQGQIPVRFVAVAAAIALVSAVVFSLLLGLPAAVAALILVAAGWSYNLGLKATVFSGMTYLIGFGALPSVAYLASAGHPWPPWWAPVTGALLGFGAHFANVLPDLRADAATGVRGLPHRLGRRLGIVVLATALGSASVVLGFGPSTFSLLFAVLTSAVGVIAAGSAALVAARAPDSSAAFRIALALALFDVILLLVAANR